MDSRSYGRIGWWVLMFGIAFVGPTWAEPPAIIQPNAPIVLPPPPPNERPQEPKIPDLYPREEPEADLVLPLGEIAKLRPQSGFPVMEASVDREKVVKIFAFNRKDAFVKLLGVGLGDAKVTLIDGKGLSKVFKVRIRPSVEYLERLLERQFPTAHLKITAGGDNLLFVEGTVETPGDVTAVVGLLENFIGRAGRVINTIRVAGPTQIQLEVCIARVDRQVLRELNFNFLAADKNFFLGNQIGNLIGVPGVLLRGGDATGGGKVFQPSTNQGQVLTPSSTLFFGLTRNSSQFFGFLDFLQRNGAVKVLANPTLVTMNGRPADFLVGGEQPVPVVVFAGGTSAPSVQFKTFGTRLTFIPVLLGEGKIRLDVLPEVSTVNFSAGINAGAGNIVPQFVTQRVHTTVEMESGQTLCLGGLLQTEIESSVEKIPVLGDVPYLGAAFRKVSHNKRNTELIVVVTPRRVDPMRDCQQPPLLPGREVRNPTDAELYLHGQIESPLDSAGKKVGLRHPANCPDSVPFGPSGLELSAPWEITPVLTSPGTSGGTGGPVPVPVLTPIPPGPTEVLPFPKQ